MATTRSPLPSNGLDSEADDTRVEMGTIVGITGCAINSASFGDVHFTNIHAYYVNASDTFCEAGAGDYWTEMLADTPAPGFAGYAVTNGYNFFIERSLSDRHLDWADGAAAHLHL